MEFKKGDIYGTHRVISPKGVLPQPADVVDNTMEIYNNEVLIDVHTLNIDSASFTEISNRANGDVEEIKRIILEIVNTTGKHKNPWTGSGGMLIGRVAEVGPDYEGELKKGDKIATMVDIKGQAILFQSGIYAKLPKDIPQTLALSVLDVAGAPAQTAKICKPGDTVVVMGGGGKSGILCCWQARKQVGINGTVICVDGFKKSINRAMSVNCADEYLVVNATDTIAMYEEIMDATEGQLADVVINVVNIPNTEMSSIIACKDGGLVYFFSMATSFTKAALGAEGIGKDVTMLVGNGYTKGHSEVALQVLREDERIRNLFAQLYA